MADPQPPRASRAYDDWFLASPDPWETVGRLEPGADATALSTLQRIIYQAEPAQHPALEAKLGKLLATAEITAFAGAWACRMLGLVGTAASVPLLAQRLRQPEGADAARYALDRISDPAVDDAYRAALNDLTGPAKAGLIGSIGLRGDKRAIDVLSTIKANAAEPSEVRIAAARALERLTAAETTSPR